MQEVSGCAEYASFSSSPTTHSTSTSHSRNDARRKGTAVDCSGTLNITCAGRLHYCILSNDDTLRWLWISPQNDCVLGVNRWN